MVDLEITNIVAVAAMQKEFNLDILNSKIEDSEFNASKNWLKWRLKPDNNYIAFYKSGKFLLTGFKNLEELNKVRALVLKKIENIDPENKFQDLKISNIVLKDEINLNKSLEDIIYQLDPDKSSYEPEQFPGLFYKDEDGISFTLFSSGKMIITGLKNVSKAKNNLDRFKELIESI